MGRGQKDNSEGKNVVHFNHVQHGIPISVGQGAKKE